MNQRKAGYLAAAAGLFLLFQGCRQEAVLYEGVQEETGAETQEQAENEEEETAVVCVYVCGEVNIPGVYELSWGARIADAVAAAGGMTGEACETFLNLAQPVTDGEKIEVPSEDEAEALKEAAALQESMLVNLNTATAEELMTLKGIGASKAEDIISCREKKGSFKSIEELMEIPGIKEGVFEKIRDQITV